MPDAGDLPSRKLVRCFRVACSASPALYFVVLKAAGTQLSVVGFAFPSWERTGVFARSCWLLQASFIQRPEEEACERSAAIDCGVPTFSLSAGSCQSGFSTTWHR